MAEYRHVLCAQLIGFAVREGMVGAESQCGGQSITPPVDDPRNFY